MNDYKYTLLAYGGAVLVSLLTILFVILKLCNVIDWTWGMVLSPIWISYVLALVAMFIYIKFI